MKIVLLSSKGLVSEAPLQTTSLGIAPEDEACAYADYCTGSIVMLVEDES